MKTSIYFSGSLILATLFISIFIFSDQVLARESDSNINADSSTTLETETKVDAGNALNAAGSEARSSTTDSSGDTTRLPIRDGGQTVDAGTVPERQQSGNTGDLDGDGYGDVTSVKPDYLDEDSDDDGLDDASKAEIEVIEYRDGDGRTTHKISVDQTTPKLMQALSIDADSPLMQAGIKMNIASDSCDPEKSGDCDDSDSSEEISPTASFEITVEGPIVRGWDPKQKEALQNKASEITTAKTPSEFGIWLTAKVLENETITEVSTLHDYVEIKYDKTARLLGFIPITMQTKARLGGRMKVGDVTLERGTGSEVELDFPWYGFLVSKKAISEEITSEVLEVTQNYDASFSAEAKFKAGKALAETVK